MSLEQYSGRGMIYEETEGKWNRGIWEDPVEGAMESAGTWCNTLGPVVRISMAVNYERPAQTLVNVEDAEEDSSDHGCCGISSLLLNEGRCNLVNLKESIGGRVGTYGEEASIRPTASPESKAIAIRRARSL